MMSSHNGSAQLSPVLFLDLQGEPMRFFLRPGVSKAELQPIIKAGGGVVCKVQEPGAILLLDPEQVAKVPAMLANCYISTKYIRDCVEKNQQLDMEDYKLNNGGAQARPVKRKQERGRMGYTPEDDAVILSYISKHMQEARGNVVWREMERLRVTDHSWQSMKDRYRKHLCLQSNSPKMTSLWSPPDRKPSPDRTHLKTSPEETSLPPVIEKTQIRTPPGQEPQACSSKKRHAETSPEKDARLVPESSPGQSVKHVMHPQASSEAAHAQSPVRKKHRESSPESGCLDTLVEEDGVLRKDTDALAERQVVVQQSSETNRNPVNPGRNGEVVMKNRRTVTPVKGKLGILEMAIMEFEEDDETDEEILDLSLSKRPQADPEASACEHDLDVNTSREILDDHTNRKAQIELQPGKSGPQDHRSNGAVKKNIPAASNVHTFLFESQEELTNDVAFSQAQLEEAKHLLRTLMRESKQDLCSVTKALLKNSGEVQVALRYLLAGDKGRTEGPFWTRHDDNLLLSAHPSQHNLHLKYGEEGMAKRIAFLDTE
ncbi:telomeric repeat-binding factor 2-interacting protein 1 [Brienomyrus brachyistius]|uniref:telomeric repeat-binding factor 2-interacting protein 1 n=1 Tax=Brienomyrus brachyistius TaxID=42636 RepID=UPI0020B18125|nr:telomeric repeat-binding factor 2-interacting protein 1 [Brienomyrus brachyistius]XP_048879635.1 telomeric repeat-binding factor 2-interacting protein 1 [Brienomyrus brachyistius]XP_048879636.1 telomeric repeat-binding factor 2-interacting protein 1 [Brienomyrus brachyistius]